MKNADALNNKDIYILGAGGMAKEAYSLLGERGLTGQVKGFLVGNGNIGTQMIFDRPVCKFDKRLLPPDVVFVSAIGNPSKALWIESLKLDGYLFMTLVSDAVYLDQSVKLGEGAIICRGVSLTCDIEIGKHAIVNTGAIISHDVMIGDYVHISPGVTVGGNVAIGSGSWIGIGSTIRNGINIGQNVFIGAGSVIVDDIGSDVLAYGVPAKRIRSVNRDDFSELIKKGKRI